MHNEEQLFILIMIN